MIPIKTVKALCLAMCLITCVPARAAEPSSTLKDRFCSWFQEHPVYTALAALAGLTYLAYKVQPGTPTTLTIDNEEVDVKDAQLNLSHRGPLRLSIRRLSPPIIDICLKQLTHEAVKEGTQQRVFAFGYDSEYDATTKQDVINQDRIVLEEHPTFKPWPSRWSPDAYARVVEHKPLADMLKARIQN
jgi:hypothetical protein